jgi:hypothetical protein
MGIKTSATQSFSDLKTMEHYYIMGETIKNIADLSTFLTIH